MSSTIRLLRPQRLCTACLINHRGQSLRSIAALAVQTRARSTGPPDQGPVPLSTRTHSPRSRQPPVLSPEDFKQKPPPSPVQIARLVVARIPEWTTSMRTMSKLEAYGFDKKSATDFLSSWTSIQARTLSGVRSDDVARSGLADLKYELERLTLAVRDENFGDVMEAAFLRNFLSFTLTDPRLSTSLSTHLKTILGVTDLTRIAYQFDNVGARSLKRHFHMHIGPTNSGKTYSALKRLSTASTGAYAGPLRLLAHEVWERMNLGTVGGMTAGQGRACNLITGEERRIVDPNAGIISCTVEMLPPIMSGEPYEVVVVDEIQMIGDPQRGGSWTSAILGLQAKEIHLCGDETTVDMLQGIITSLGDKLTVHRYERLTPLAVAEESLDGDWNKIEKGDCVVTFSRSNIFAVKKLIESTAGKKCAVVYGALPPETRADQARDFNDENGRAEVLVASDAVGMGLNLKIKRMVFESLHKFNGKTDVPLALTQIKQIAGRAGRFGLHKTKPTLDADKEPDLASSTDEVPSPGGLVTTLHKVDLPVLRSLLPLPLPNITRAVIDFPFETLGALNSLLPAGTTYAQLLDHTWSLIKLPPSTVMSSAFSQTRAAEALEQFRPLLTLVEMSTFTFAPVNMRDDRSLLIFQNTIKAFAEDGRVPLNKIFGNTRLVETLKMVEETLASLPPLPPIEGIGRRLLTPPVLISSLPAMEILHKALVLYIWLSFRFDLSFLDRPYAVELKQRTEVVLDACLERLPGLRNKKTHERGAEVDRQVRDWRRGFVGSDGKLLEGGERGKKKIREAKIKMRRGKYEGGSTDRAKVGAEKPAAKKIEWTGIEERDQSRKKEMWRNVALLQTDQAPAARP